jgi:hypothetical protein
MLYIYLTEVMAYQPRRNDALDFIGRRRGDCDLFNWHLAPNPI